MGEKLWSGLVGSAGGEHKRWTQTPGGVGPLRVEVPEAEGEKIGLSPVVSETHKRSHNNTSTMEPTRGARGWP